VTVVQRLQPCKAEVGSGYLGGTNARDLFSKLAFESRSNCMSALYGRSSLSFTEGLSISFLCNLIRVALVEPPEPSLCSLKGSILQYTRAHTALLHVPFCSLKGSILQYTRAHTALLHVPFFLMQAASAAPRQSSRLCSRRQPFSSNASGGPGCL